MKGFEAAEHSATHVKAVFLDFGTLGPDSVDPSPLYDVLPGIELHDHTAEDDVAGRIRKAEVVLTTPYGSTTAEAYYRRAPFIERVHEGCLQDGALRLGETAVVCGTFFDSETYMEVRLAGAPQEVEQMTASATERCLRFRVDDAAQGGLLEVENRWGTTEVGDFDVVEVG